jgi:hypothetical protein
MSRIAFGKNPEQPGAAPVEQLAQTVSTPAAGVTVECQTTVAGGVPAVYTPPAPPARRSAPYLDEENVGFEDIIMPRLNLVQGVGKMSTIWAPGTILFNKDCVIFDPGVADKKLPNGEIQPGRPATDPVILTVVGFQKDRFVEKVEGGIGGATVKTEAEVAQLGGTLDYNEDREKRKLGIPSKLFQTMATALVFFQKPNYLTDEKHLVFPYECEDKYFAMALWSMKGTAYTHGAKVIRTHGKLGHLRKDGRTCYRLWNYQFATILKPFNTDKGENFVRVPVLNAGTENSAAFLKLIDDVMGFGS